MKSKKIVSFMLALALCVPMATADIINNESSVISTYADTTEDGFQYVINTTQGFVAITGYSGSAIDIVIPSEFESCYIVNIVYDYGKTSVTTTTETTIDDNNFKKRHLNCNTVSKIGKSSSMLKVKNNINMLIKELY